jgi:hypothetical protein
LLASSVDGVRPVVVKLTIEKPVIVRRGSYFEIGGEGLQTGYLNDDSK